MGVCLQDAEPLAFAATLFICQNDLELHFPTIFGLVCLQNMTKTSFEHEQFSYFTLQQVLLSSCTEAAVL